MSTPAADATDQLEALEAWVDEVEARGAMGAVLLVEGEKDEGTLRRLGITARIARVHGQGSLMRVAEALAAEGAREVILLTDWDRTGGRLARRLSEILAATGLRVDLELRGQLARAAREIRHVESLDTYLLTLRDRAGTPASDSSLL